MDLWLKGFINFSNKLLKLQKISLDLNDMV